MKVFTGYTGPFPKVTGHEFDGLKKSLEQDEKLWVDVNDGIFLSEELNYNPLDKNSIIEYSKSFIGKSLREINKEYCSHLEINPKNKGEFGRILEAAAYRLKNNSRPEPDFKIANLEIKSTGFIYSKRKRAWRFKERLSIEQLNFFDYVNETFWNSSAIKKIDNTLIVGYEYHKGISPIDNKIILIHPLKFSKEEYKIMENDYNIGQEFVKQGKVNEINESLFQALAINTKGKNHNDTTRQPFSDEHVTKRGFSLKSSFLTKKLPEIIDNCDDEVKKIFL